MSDKHPWEGHSVEELRSEADKAGYILEKHEGPVILQNKDRNAGYTGGKNVFGDIDCAMAYIYLKTGRPWGWDYCHNRYLIGEKP